MTSAQWSQARSTGGEFEDRLKAFLKEVTDCAGPIFSSLTNYTRLWEPVQPKLGRCIEYAQADAGAWRAPHRWATTIDEYRKYTRERRGAGATFPAGAGERTER